MNFSDISQRIRGGSWECNYSLHSLPGLIADWQQEKEGGLQMLPDFQRGHVWTPQQQTDYIEYFLQGNVTGMVLYFNQPSWHYSAKTAYNDFVIVDGLQRLTALLQFMDNKVPAFGHTLSDFSGSLRNLRTFHDIKINVNDLQTKAEVLTWYLQMNAGGTPHTAAEIERVRALLAQEGVTAAPAATP